MITASLDCTKSKKITFSSSDEDEEDEDEEDREGGTNDSSKIVMFSSDDEEDAAATSVASLGVESSTAPCPTSDEARFRLKEDYNGAAGKELIKLQRRIGTDALSHG